MKEDKIETRIKELRRIINYHNSLYYQDDRPEINDSEYDTLFRELIQLESSHPQYDSPDSPTKKVGGEPSEYFAKFQHSQPMLSLDSVYEESEIVGFDNRISKIIGRDPDYVCEPKLDGLSVEVQYRDGIFHAAATRGDGYIGEDVTANVRTIRNLPLSIGSQESMAPSFISIRGEVVMPLSAFKELNETLEKSGKNGFANCRNASAGSLRLLDPSVTAQRPLVVFFYDILEISSSGNPQNHLNELEFLKYLGLPVVFSYRHCIDLNQVKSYKDEIEKLRNSLDYDIDGFVIKVNSLEHRHILGGKERSPRWAIAVKFSPGQATTIIKDIKFQVGRTGIITPVADLEPVVIKGARISRVSLHNFDYTTQKDIRKDDAVILQRAGDVIPELVSVITAQRNGSQVPLSPPSSCPVCGSPVNREGAYLYCTGTISCPSQVIYSISHFASKNGMDIESLSSKTIGTLFNYRLIKDISDLYQLKKEEVVKLPLFGEKSAQNLLKAIEESKNRPLNSFLFALGIRGVGLHLSNVLARRYKTVKEIESLDPAQLSSINEIGPKISWNIHQFFSNERNRDILRRLFELGVSPAPAKEPVNSFFSGKAFVLTGSLAKFTRAEAQNLIAARGGIIQTGISRKTDFLIAGSDPGSKLEKAQKLGIKILKEQDLVSLLKS